ncbi:single-stranded DNA-binding protein [Candidatus Berkelbacteria bacterium]|nr:single-stranded DNA-binding protein [Candidatus Berkelbacteria bacterium]
MISLNRATILGNVTRDPELRTIPSGQQVTTFGVATNRRYKNAHGTMIEDVQFHDIVAWGKLAEIIIQIFRKGSKIYLEGRLQTRQWDAPDGSKRSRTEIVMDTFIPLTPKGAVMGDAGAPMSEAIAEPEATQPATNEPGTKKTKSKKTDDTPKDSAKDHAPEGEIDLDEIPF